MVQRWRFKSKAVYIMLMEELNKIKVAYGFIRDIKGYNIHV
jgi:hypothetical protein